MAKYKVVLQPTAEKDFAKHKKAGNSATIKKITNIIEDLENHPYTGVGKPEQLKYDLQDYWSRQINQKDRMIYKVKEDVVTVFVLSAMGHYSDK
jgi:toxin YoeB